MFGCFAHPAKRPPPSRIGGFPRLSHLMFRYVGEYRRTADPARGLPLIVIARITDTKPDRIPPGCSRWGPPIGAKAEGPISLGATPGGAERVGETARPGAVADLKSRGQHRSGGLRAAFDRRGHHRCGPHHGRGIRCVRDRADHHQPVHGLRSGGGRAPGRHPGRSILVPARMEVMAIQ